MKRSSRAMTRGGRRGGAWWQGPLPAWIGLGGFAIAVFGLYETLRVREEEDKVRRQIEEIHAAVKKGT